MPCVIRLLGPADAEPVLVFLAALDEATPCFYLKKFDPEAHFGRGSIVATQNVDEAIHFVNKVAAIECYRTRPRSKPTRPDGLPNRPLTAYHVEIREL